MMKTVHMAVYDTFADWEVGHATAHINRAMWHREPGTWQVRTVGIGRDAVTSAGGMRVVPDVTLAELSPADSAMLILPGADTWETGALTPFADKAREFLAAGVPVAGICGATFGLAAAGLLDERAHTSNAAEYLAYSGYSGADRFVYEPAVTDGDLITATGTRPVEFARAILARLDIYEPHILDAWYRLYGDNDPAGFFALVEYEQQRSAEATAS
ncbi:glutamine amidotransferase [Nocardia otitidiscaviarum]|uniref:type 1 glutamine amidotransferase family protein n=1 Tax=Nocardia otitidiscaviarum TaxID=1823 RepID=UPI0005B78AB6|nr:type 1 glutamine amidotransferase family protein [Nocardia otitidiscaviarum]MBF6137912.1 glutamine amidotransferase [Nocardia otitidiscaviarum]MBF6488911.1 glutamine amidotransferase [Nocardia otitidiscaviarum]